MASLVFVLLAAIVILVIVLADNKKRSDTRTRKLRVLISDVDAGAIKYKRDMLARLKEL